jgi:hypothetical protein
MNIPIYARRWFGVGLISATVLTVGAIGAVRSGGLTSGEARRLIAHMPGFDLPRDAVRIKEVDAIGNSAVVVAQVETAFRLEQDPAGKWRVAEVRTGDYRWQNVDELARSLTEEKNAVAQAEIETISTAIESFHRARGFYPAVDTIAALMDSLQPHFLCRVIRTDPWHIPYSYKGSSSSFTLRSAGPDGKMETADDLVFTK